MLKRLMQVAIISAMMFGGCLTVGTTDTATKHQANYKGQAICFYGDLNPMDLLDDTKYGLLHRNGEVVMIPTDSFVLVGMVAVSNDAKVQEVMVVLIPSDVAAYAYCHRGSWYAFHYDPNTDCYVYEKDMSEEEREATEKIYKMIFQKEGC